MFSSISKLAMLVGLTLLAFGNQPLAADDWAKWMGPQQDNSWNETGLIDKFPDGGPKVLWRSKVAHGYSGPAVAGGRVFITDYVTDDNVKIANFQRTKSSGIERVLCLDEKTGEEIWKHEYKVVYGISYPSGPRCTPIVEEDRVYCLGAEGKLICFKVEDGEVVWEVDLVKQYKTKAALWGYAAHPIIDGDQLITLAGGDGSHVVAFDKLTGKEKWKSGTAPEQGYSPPRIIEAGGVRQLILAQPDAIESVNPSNGELYWSVPYKATSNSIIMRPIFFDNYLYVAGYSNQSMLIKLDANQPTAKIEWTNKARAISPVNVQPYFNGKEKVLYGMDQSGDMVALELPTCKRLWNTSAPVSKRRTGNGTAFVVRQADRFWLFNENGELVIAKMTPECYTEIDRAKVIDASNNAFGREVVWSMPAFANRKAFIRNDDEIICLDLAK